MIVITTGGTIEGIEHKEKINYSSFKINSPLVYMLQQIMGKSKFEFYQIFQKDSKFITNSDLQLLLKKCRSTFHNKILITHGTHTMVNSAKFIGNQSIQKKIIFTGSFILGNLPNSDAYQNLKFAIQSFKTVNVGTYIAMNNIVFNYNKVYKDYDNNIFKNIN